jgi:PIN domain nuclease of toxin-antitoxin system
LWWLADDPRLGPRARSTIRAGEVFISVVSLWEIEIKRRLGRIEADTSSILESVGMTEGFHLLDVRPTHVVSLIELPQLHRDPFDRMLVAQAVRENVPLLTKDPMLTRYPIDHVW